MSNIVIPKIVNMNNFNNNNSNKTNEIELTAKEDRKIKTKNYRGLQGIPWLLFFSITVIPLFFASVYYIFDYLRVNNIQKKKDNKMSKEQKSFLKAYLQTRKDQISLSIFFIIFFVLFPLLTHEMVVDYFYIFKSFLQVLMFFGYFYYSIKFFEKAIIRYHDIKCTYQ